MTLPRFFCNPQPNASYSVGDDVVFTFEESDLHHIAHVMRVAVGEQIEIVVRDSWQALRVEVIAFESDGLRARITEVLSRSETACTVGLFFGLSKGDKNDTIVRQAVEIGANELYPCLFERSVVKLDAKKTATRHARLQKIAQSAAQQSHRSAIPAVAAPASLSSPEVREALASYDVLYVLWEETLDNSLVTLVENALVSCEHPRRFGCVVGPEGGITQKEIDYLVEIGAQLATLGPTILRVDTANAVTLGVLCSLILKYENAHE